MHQTVFGNVEKLAGRDINESNFSTIVLLDVLAEAVQESPGIPIEEKRTLLEKIRELRDNPWMVGVGGGVILKMLESVLT